MSKKTIYPNIWSRVLGFLSHPAWNGLSCFFTALGTFIGVGSIVLAYILGLFSYAQNLFKWLLSPVSVPLIVPLGFTIILFVLIYKYSVSRFHKMKQESTILASNNISQSFEPTPVDIEIMKSLAMAKEGGKYWVEVSVVAQKHKLSKVHVEYFLRILEKHGFVHHHTFEGTWGIKDRGVDYLIEKKYI